MKTAGEISSPARPGHADQRFEPRNPAGAQIDDRLIFEPEAFRPDRRLDGPLQQQAILILPAHPVIEEVHAVAAGRLGGIAGDVGPPHQLRGLPSIGRRHRRPDAGIWLGPLALPLDGPGQELDDPPAHPLRLAGDRFAADDDAERVAAEPRHHTAADAGGQPLRHRRKHMIAALLAEGVVDLHEMIDVDQHHRGFASPCRIAGEDVVQRFDEGLAIGKPGQRVVAGEVADLGGALALLEPEAGMDHHCGEQQQARRRRWRFAPPPTERWI